MNWTNLIEQARRNHNVVSVEAARAAGIGRTTFDQRVSGEGWSRPWPGIALLPGASDAWITRAAAALAYLGPDAALTRWWALRLHGVSSWAPADVQVLLGAERVSTVLPGIDAVRSRVIPPGHIVEAQGLRTATVARALVDLSARLRLDRFRSLVIDARFRNDRLLRDLAEVHAVRGRYPGRAKVRAVLADLEDDGSDSGFELRARERLLAAGFPPPTQQVDVPSRRRTYHLDLAWPSHGIGIECVGWAYHHSRDQLDRDATRHNAIVMAGGWRVLQLTWTMMFDGWAGFVADLRRAFASSDPVA